MFISSTVQSVLIVIHRLQQKNQWSIMSPLNEHFEAWSQVYCSLPCWQVPKSKIPSQDKGGSAWIELRWDEQATTDYGRQWSNSFIIITQMLCGNVGYNVHMCIMKCNSVQ